MGSQIHCPIGRLDHNQGPNFGTAAWYLWTWQYLPPFDHGDRRGAPGVEDYSGGVQMWLEGTCPIQRILPIDPESFSKLLLYHTSSNKQASITRERRVWANNILGQLNTLRKKAEQAAKQKILPASAAAEWRCSSCVIVRRNTEHSSSFPYAL